MPVPPAADADGAGGVDPTTRIWVVLGSLVSQTAVLTALLYYFGWVRTKTTYGHFGVDTRLLDFSTTDYLLRSLNSVLTPLIVAGFLALALRAAHRQTVLPVITAGDRRRLVTRAVVMARGSAVLLAALVLVGLLAEDRVGASLGSALPLAMIAATGLLGYAEHLSTFTTRAVPDTGPTRVRSLALLILTLVGLLWAVSSYAVHVGREMAADVVASLPSEPELVLYSAERLAVAGPGVTVDEIGQEGSRYRYRYSGLRLLVHTRDRYVLLPAQWERGRDHVYLIPTNGNLRIDLVVHAP
ncbi:hypothetical protein [Micromonospora sagamiensis]|uniref:hypothetical protein n=1 Tax=Micromonospora sagamiensis TaxID=47875 RepID=UPI0011AA527D|nr:hypothetical protein [Micromonospora sagamiensis]BCL12307.1 hypothetical protein GCM10017556_00460 [Micromonospora sagamiensis]